jgi:hypothetical protein
MFGSGNNPPGTSVGLYVSHKLKQLEEKNLMTPKESEDSAHLELRERLEQSIDWRLARAQEALLACSAPPDAESGFGEASSLLQAVQLAAERAKNWADHAEQVAANIGELADQGRLEDARNVFDRILTAAAASADAESLLAEKASTALRRRLDSLEAALASAQSLLALAAHPSCGFDMGWVTRMTARVAVASRSVLEVRDQIFEAGNLAVSAAAQAVAAIVSMDLAQDGIHQAESADQAYLLEVMVKTQARRSDGLG